MQVLGGANKAAAMDDLEPFYPLKEGEEAHWEVRGQVEVVWSVLTCSMLQVVERILFLYAKTNKGIGYVQVYTISVLHS